MRAAPAYLRHLRPCPSFDGQGFIYFVSLQPALNGRERFYVGYAKTARHLARMLQADAYGRGSALTREVIRRGGRVVPILVVCGDKSAEFAIKRNGHYNRVIKTIVRRNSAILWRIPDAELDRLL